MQYDSVLHIMEASENAFCIEQLFGYGAILCVVLPRLK